MPKFTAAVLSLIVTTILLPYVAAATHAQTRRPAASARRTSRPARTRAARRSSAASTAKPATPPKLAATIAPASPVAATTASGLTYVVTRRGAGERLLPGRRVSVHYTGLLTNGTQFDSSRTQGEPITFELGAGRVIKGWDEGLALLRVGDHATFIIPPELGYGSRGAGDGVIPPGATLIFVVEVVGMEAAPASPASAPPERR